MCQLVSVAPTQIPPAKHSVQVVSEVSRRQRTVTSRSLVAVTICLAAATQIPLARHSVQVASEVCPAEG